MDNCGRLDVALDESHLPTSDEGYQYASANDGVEDNLVLLHVLLSTTARVKRLGSAPISGRFTLIALDSLTMTLIESVHQHLR